MGTLPPAFRAGSVFEAERGPCSGRVSRKPLGERPPTVGAPPGCARRHPGAQKLLAGRPGERAVRPAAMVDRRRLASVAKCGSPAGVGRHDLAVIAALMMRCHRPPRTGSRRRRRRARCQCGVPAAAPPRKYEHRGVSRKMPARPPAPASTRRVRSTTEVFRCGSGSAMRPNAVGVGDRGQQSSDNRPCRAGPQPSVTTAAVPGSMDRWPPRRGAEVNSTSPAGQSGHAVTTLPRTRHRASLQHGCRSRNGSPEARLHRHGSYAARSPRSSIQVGLRRGGTAGDRPDDGKPRVPADHHMPKTSRIVTRAA